MISKIVKWLVVACVVVGIYKIFGGDLSSFISSIGTAAMQIIDAGSDIVAQLWDALFGK